MNKNMKIGIVTLYSNNNYGNKLQNYAVQEFLKSNGYSNVKTIKNKFFYTKYDKVKLIMNKIARFLLLPFSKRQRINLKNKINKGYYKKSVVERENNFIEFDKYIIKSDYFEDRRRPSKELENEYDCFIVGSDQVWNPHERGIDKLFLLPNIKGRKISLSASIGIDEFPYKFRKSTTNSIIDFQAISVREHSGKRIIDDMLNKNDTIVLLDPTMLLPTSEWNKVIKKPKQIDELCTKNEGFILNYFLGELSENKKKEIYKIAELNNCKIINILDENDPFYICGPSEFLWLEKNAFLICTDSFHSSVFAILYSRPFIVYNRDDGQIGKNKMNSRIETLLSIFNLENRYYKNKITNDLLKCDYTYSQKILKAEREKAKVFLDNALK